MLDVEEAYMKEKGLALAILVLLLSLTSICARPIHSQSIGARIDLYTQREPYSGRGLDMPSDAFGPGEEIQIFACVTYNDYPVQGILVAYGVFGPENLSGRMIFYRSAITDENGTATVTFRVSYLNEANFGNWTVIGNTNVGGFTVQDTVFFRVGWLVEIVSMGTVNEMNQTQTEFVHRSVVGIKLVLKSIAMTEKSVTIAIVVNDSLNMRVASMEISNFVVPPNEIQVEAYSYFSIPDRANVGVAMISAGLYTATVANGGTAYSPEVLAFFMIVTRDVAVVNVVPATQYVRKGEDVTIDVHVRNRGSRTESFNVLAYRNGTVIDNILVTDLAPNSERVLLFVWNTDSVQTGNYIISAYAVPVPGETSLADNIFVDGYVNVKDELHDVAVIGVTPSTPSGFIGTVVNVTVIVKNLGLFSESFNVMLLINSTITLTLQVSNLESGGQQSLVFAWNTQDLDEGNYTICGMASQVQDEINVGNNLYIDGVVELKNQPTQPILFHDVAIIGLTPSVVSAFIGTTVDIAVVIVNNGNYSETFNVTVYYDSVAIGTIDVLDFSAAGTKILIFHWNTQNVAEGNYTLSTLASVVPDEVDVANNAYVDGTVRLTALARTWFVFEWWHLLLLLLLLLLIIILIIWVYRRRKKKKNVGGSFDAAWSAWYYGYGVSNRFLTS